MPIQRRQRRGTGSRSRRHPPVQPWPRRTPAARVPSPLCADRPRALQQRCFDLIDVTACDPLHSARPHAPEPLQVDLPDLAFRRALMAAAVTRPDVSPLTVPMRSSWAIEKSISYRADQSSRHWQRIAIDGPGRVRSPQPSLGRYGRTAQGTSSPSNDASSPTSHTIGTVLTARAREPPAYVPRRPPYLPVMGVFR